MGILHNNHPNVNTLRTCPIPELQKYYFSGGLIAMNRLKSLRWEITWRKEKDWFR
jgi:hypothetical protein